MDQNNGIGYQGKLPWHCSEDMEWFKRHTLNKQLIMGRKTFEAIGKPLSNRVSIVHTRDPQYPLSPTHGVDSGVAVLSNDLDETLAQIAGGHPLCYYRGEEYMIVGGGEVYKKAMPYANRLLITRFDHDFTVDAYFPEIDPNIWHPTWSKQGLFSHPPLSYTFYEYTRK